MIQRVYRAAVYIHGSEHAGIAQGMCIFIGVAETDTLEDVAWLAAKVRGLRIFQDHEGKMNLSIADTGGEILCISQFTLHASTRKGNRPSFVKAAKPEIAIPLYESFIQDLRKSGIAVKSGIFGADMDVHIVNQGPVTIMIDSELRE